MHDERSYTALIGRMAKDREAATQALKEIGTTCQTWVIKLLDDPDHDIQLAACKLLGEIGTEHALKALQALAEAKKDAALTEAANKAITVLYENHPDLEPLPPPGK